MKRIFAALLAACMLMTAAALAEGTPFAAEYEMAGTTSAGKLKNDTFIFEGMTDENGIITELNFDIIRNKGTDAAYSKKDIMGYMINVSDATVKKTDAGLALTGFTAYGYDEAFGEGSNAQFMVSASCENLTDETAFGELTFISAAAPDAPLAIDKAIIAYSYVAKEAGVETLTAETPVKDILTLHGLYKDGAFVEGTNRVSYAGYNGGRSYGEQIDAIVAYILEQKMTLEDVYEMFKTVNQQSTPIKERDTVAGATIAFVGDFQRMVYLAIHGELFEGVVTSSESDGQTKVEVVTQGFGGEIETNVFFDADGRIVSVAVRDDQESEGIGANLTAEGAEFLGALVAGQDDVKSVAAVSGATVTSEALKKAVQLAQDYIAK